ncbi:S1 family peptidase [Streptomyces crystallinus]
MRIDLGLSREQARARLRNEAAGAVVARRLAWVLGAAFAGAWVEGAGSSRVIVATTDPARVPAIAADGAEGKSVRHSLRALTNAKSRLDRAAVRRHGLGTLVWYVDVRTNRVVVQARSRAAARELIAGAGVDAALLSVQTVQQQPHLLHGIRGGDAFYRPTDGGRCSVGFAVTRGKEKGFVTAGHCGRKGTTTRGFNKRDQGVFRASVFPGADMAWVATNSAWAARPYVKGGRARELEITGSAEALVGASVCRSGSTSGWHCGIIEQHDVTVAHAEGTVTGVTRTSVCAEHGDSGGPYVAGDQAQGVTSGGTGNCTTGGTSFYQPINPLLERYGLTLVTTGNGPARV